MLTQEELETKIINKLISRSIYSEKLYNQFSNSKIIARNFSGCGFFTTFIINDINNIWGIFDKNYKLGCTFEMESLIDGAGAILFFKDGYMHVLEVYTYDEVWPKEVKDIKFNIS